MIRAARSAETSGGGPGCPACGGGDASRFYEVDGVPAHSVLLMETRETARGYPRGRVELRHCEGCGFVFNAAFDPALSEYSGRYEETQGFSPTFRGFHRRLARDLVDRWDLRGKHVLEIGCGKGEFLALLCETGGNTGVGFDPAFVPARNPVPDHLDVRFRRETYPPGRQGAREERPPDFVCCKMTLEHIPDVRRFLVDVRRSLVGADDPVVFFQVPEAGRIFRETAFWDVYYEHCSYFTRGSLVRLFDRCGFEVVDAWTDYGGQYLMTAAVPADAGGTAGPGPSRARGLQPRERPGDTVAPDVRRFAEAAQSAAAGWRDRIRAEREAGGSVCLWGAGSKAVSFLSAVGEDLVSTAVDINPHKQGTYLPGSGVEIVAPGELRRNPPTLVVVMNPVYLDEVAGDLREMGVSARVAHPGG